MSERKNPDPADTEFEEHVISEVARDEDGMGCSIGFDSFGIGVPGDTPIVPEVGMTVRLYSKGFGFPVRGMVINGVTVYYRTEEEQEEEHKAWVKASRERQWEEYQKSKADFEVRTNQLPGPLAKRLRGFLRRSDEAWNGYGYELFASEEAVKMAAWAKDDPQKIRTADSFPGMSDEHSGNTFGTARRLAYVMLTESPETVEMMHAGICALVGCREAGCYSLEVAQDGTALS